MALASYTPARSVVELSLSPVFHYQFSSINKAIRALAPLDKARPKVQEQITRFCLGYAGRRRDTVLLQTDTTPLCKPHSPTLDERTYVHIADNTVAQNLPLSVGYEVSFLNLSCGTWSLPLSIERVGPAQTATECALAQLDRVLPLLSDRLVVNWNSPGMPDTLIRAITNTGGVHAKPKRLH